MISVFASNALLLPGSVATKKAIVITALLILGLAVDVQAVSGNISEIALPRLSSLKQSAALDSNYSVAPVSSSGCTTEVSACFSDDACVACMEETDDDDSECAGFFIDCDGLWEDACCSFTQNDASCSDNVPLFDYLHCVVQSSFGDCPASELCSSELDDISATEDDGPATEDDGPATEDDGPATEDDGSATTTPSLECISEAYACVNDEPCSSCRDQTFDNDTQIDDDSMFEEFTDCDQLWETMCTTFTESSATCADNELLFNLVHCHVQVRVDDCPASKLCSGAMSFARSSGAAVAIGTVAAASLFITAVGMAL